jgi:protein-L-isoaspartate(D-aspartate) O-methyltransferase
VYQFSRRLRINSSVRLPFLALPFPRIFDFTQKAYNWAMPDRDSIPDEFTEARRAMVEGQIRKRGVSSPRVLEAMLSVPRHEFVPAEFQSDAYADKPLPIGEGQTISQPYIVGAMTEALELTGAERVLEIGAGSGYQAAVLSLLASEVITVESQTQLALAGQERLTDLGYTNVHVHNGDGSAGFPDAAPYDAILVTAAAPEIPWVLAAQLSEGGRLVIPVGSQENQELLQARKENGELKTRVLFDCRFVPLLGRYGWRRDGWRDDMKRWGRGPGQKPS